MSGGHWGYLQPKLEEWGESVGLSMELLAAIEHEMDWGLCNDTCYDCAKRRVVAALEAFFDDYGRSNAKALALLRDRRQNLCRRCVGRQ